MMAQPSYTALSSPVSVIGAQFLAPYQFDIIVDINSSRNLVITDTNHKIMLKVKRCGASFHDQLLLVDVDDKPIVMIRDKMHKMESPENGKSVKDKFMVTIYPNVDYAFVVTLIAIVEAMKSPNTKNAVAGQAGGGVGGMLGAITFS
ncbi:hypothetical protein L2E82_11409 [Cichorium intybus]|uniref:Uncharacterized protein n=1 Tax=Cichorium intybus TaxID=13427 RepID=A0ACB9GD88_CICIN|nr:hypothetical protein L2E82_11409 [Cichorium intybus]